MTNILTNIEALDNVEAILAVDENGGLAKDGIIPWKSKTDLRFFRTKTMNNVILMGSKTLLSLPNKKPLSGRINVVLTNNKNKYMNMYNEYNNVFFVTFMEALSILKNEYKDKIIFIIGGNQIYNLFLTYCNKIWLTRIKTNYQCNLFLTNTLYLSRYTKEYVYEDEELEIIKYSSC